jgi:sugar lactone lactonase YvrE
VFLTLALISALFGTPAHLGLRPGEFQTLRIDAQADNEIVTGPAGRSEWVTSQSGALLEIDAHNGHVLRHALHVHGTRQAVYPDEMAFDTAGNIYVDDFNDSPQCGIGEVRGTGDVVLHSSPSGDCAIGGIAAAAGRKMWFMEDSHVASISPGGSIQEFALPTISYAGIGSPIAVGADGKIWFVTNGFESSTLFRLDPKSGEIVKFYTFASCGGINTLVLGRDGRLYTACGLVTNLGSPGAVFGFQTSGEVTWYTDEDLGYNGSVGGIAVGPGDNLMFPPLAYGYGGLEDFSPYLPRFEYYALLDQNAPGASSVAMGRDGIVWATGTAYNGRLHRHVAYGYVVAYRL